MIQPANELRRLNHLVYIPFTGVGIGNASRQRYWLHDRIEIFKKYTLKSLLNQRERNFTLWLSFRSEDRFNWLIDDLRVHLIMVGMPAIITFDGLMYWDDKFDKEPVKMLKNALRIIRGCWRNNSWSGLFSSIKELLSGKNDTLRDRISNSLGEIAKIIPPSYMVYMTRLDSDDMLNQDAIAKIQAAPLCQAICMKNGYIHNKDTDEVAYWKPRTNPPFHTIIFPWDIFFDSKQHIEWYRGFKSHEDVTKIFDCEYLEDGLYCVLTHNPKNHISTNWDHPYRERNSKLKWLGIGPWFGQ